MMRRVLGSSGGFTYVAALVMVIITGIMLSQAAVVWKTKMQREREIELIFRGTQIRDALRRWYNFTVVEGRGVTAPASPTTPARGNLPELKALLKDPSSAAAVRFLRPSSLIDPITGKEWDVVKDASQKIVGVKSTSEAEPIKKGNFPFDLHPGDFEGKKKYSEWQFVYTQVPPVGPTGGANNPNNPVPPRTL